MAYNKLKKINFLLFFNCFKAKTKFSRDQTPFSSFVQTFLIKSVLPSPQLIESKIGKTIISLQNYNIIGVLSIVLT